MTCWLTWPLPHNISQQSIITLTLYAAISTTTDNSNINRSINPSSPRTSVPPSFNSGWWYDQAKPTHPYHHEMWSSALAKHLPLFLLWWNRERWQPVRRCPCQELMSCPLKIQCHCLAFSEVGLSHRHHFPQGSKHWTPSHHLQQYQQTKTHPIFRSSDGIQGIMWCRGAKQWALRTHVENGKMDEAYWDFCWHL